MRALSPYPSSGSGRCSSGCVTGRTALGPRAGSESCARLGYAAGEGLRLGRGAGSQRRAQRHQLAVGVRLHHAPQQDFLLLCQVGSWGLGQGEDTRTEDHMVQDDQR